MMRIFITGGTGFVGKALVNELCSEDYDIVATVRKHSSQLPEKVEQIYIKDLSQLEGQCSLTDGLKNIDVVIHAAARVHVMQDDAADPLVAFRKNNVDMTVSLAQQAADAGVKRFIYLSSIKVNGESTENCNAFRETDVPAPEDAYGQSKLEAEQLLLELAKTSSMEVVIIRPPIIYGPGVKANFASMIKIIQKGIPLPFGAIFNQRSMLAIDNLVSFIKLCITHPAAANEVFLIADGEDVSTTILLRQLAKAYRRPSRLIPIPVSWMKAIARFTGKEKISDRLFGNLQIDISKAEKTLGWKPVTSMEKQLNKTAGLNKNASLQKN